MTYKRVQKPKLSLFIISCKFEPCAARAGCVDQSKNKVLQESCHQNEEHIFA